MADKWKLCLLFIVVVTTSMDFVQSNNCAEFVVKELTVSDDSVATLNFTVNYKRECFAKYDAVHTIVVARQNKEPPTPLCQIVVFENGTCTATLGCRCMQSPDNIHLNLYRVTSPLGNVSGETWGLRGSLRNGETFWKQIWIDSTSESTTDVFYDAPVTTEASDTDTQGSQFSVTVIALSSSLAAAVVIIIVVIAVSCRLRHSPGQVNARSAEVEMAAVYSRPDPDVHHYLGLPPNRHAPTVDEAGYMEVIDDPEHEHPPRPESAIYTEPRESPSPSSSLLPSNVPGDYLHPVASAQERV